MRAYIQEGQIWAGSPPQHVCLCPQKDAGGCCTQQAAHGRPPLLDLVNGACELPLMPQCEAAYLRKQDSGRPQTLLLFEVEPVMQDASMVLPADICPVAVCALGKLGHADLLHALACGFDTICLQAAAGSGSRLQAQDVQLAQTLGGEGRIRLFSSPEELARLLHIPVQFHMPADPAVLAVGSRRDTARACAAALLPPARTCVELPEQAPYGAVTLDETLCNHCSSCVWVCPSDALSLSENGSELNFVESRCFQCGLCISICPQRALKLQPQMDLSAAAVLPQRPPAGGPAGHGGGSGRGGEVEASAASAPDRAAGPQQAVKAK